MIPVTVSNTEVVPEKSTTSVKSAAFADAAAIRQDFSSWNLSRRTLTILTIREKKHTC